jgi:N-acetyl-anhydromuramyl-L-alanine amidase AmpD
MNIEFIETKNFYSRSGYKPEIIVLHIMQGTMNGTISWFKNPKSYSSAHYLVGKDGRVVQMVKDADGAWHAGRVYNPSENIKRVLKKTRWGGYINPNKYSLGIECEGKDGDHWTEPQMKSLTDLVRTLCARFDILRDRLHIIDHQDIASYKPQLDSWVAEVIRRLHRPEVGSEDREVIKRQIVALVEQL